MVTGLTKQQRECDDVLDRTVDVWTWYNDRADKVTKKV